MTYILGINAYHGDSSACLINDGRLEAAAEEERFRRIKHWAGFPSEAINYCLEEAQIVMGDVQHVAINTDPKANALKKIKFALVNRPDLGLVMDRLHSRRQRTSLEHELERAFPDSPFTGEVHYVQHHLAHLASAFYVSPFDEALAVSVDGFGDFASAAWGMGRGTRLTLDQQIYFPHSLGMFYLAMTQYLGFPHYGDEYKVMGLAPYGEPKYVDKLQDVVHLMEDGTYELNLDYFRHHRDKVMVEWRGSAPHIESIFTDKLADLLGPARDPASPLEQRHRDIARSTQAMYEQAFFHLLNKLHARYGTDRVALAGGCAMNSVANGKIYRNTPFRQVYIQAAAGDAGGAIGAAYAVWHERNPDALRFPMNHAYWGTHYENGQLTRVLSTNRTALDAQRCTVEELTDEAALCDRTARAIAEGKVIGWFQGRMEWGPRALGNRSILGDPRRSDMKDLLNQKIKRRESFRPFAPSVLREAVPDWFETDDEVPFMMQVYQIRPEKRPSIPAVTHVDGSGRLQTVHGDTNPRYYRLIKSFEASTGVPMVLNTSFNENEPVVCRPEEALDCFLRTKMDVLVLGNWYISRNS